MTKCGVAVSDESKLASDSSVTAQAPLPRQLNMSLCPAFAAPMARAKAVNLIFETRGWRRHETTKISRKSLKNFPLCRVLVFVMGAFAEMSEDVSRICDIIAHDLARTHVPYYNDDAKRTKGM